MRHLNLILIASFFLLGLKGYGPKSFAPVDHLLFKQLDDIQTTDATQTVAGTITLNDPSTHIVMLTCEGRKSDGTKREGFRKSVLAYRSGGTATIEGNIVNMFTQPGTSYDITFGVSGNDLQFLVTGAASETVDWRCVYCTQVLE